MVHKLYKSSEPCRVENVHFEAGGEPHDAITPTRKSNEHHAKNVKTNKIALSGAETLSSRTKTQVLVSFWSALETPDPGAPNGGSNFIFRPFGADLVTFDLTELPNKWKFLWFFCQLIWLLMFQLDNFKSDEIGSKRSDYDVWHLVGCASVRAL